MAFDIMTGTATMLRRLLLATVFVGSVVPGAGAQTVANVFREFGLLGTFAADCKKPPGGSNTHTIYAADPNGRVTLTYDNGTGDRTVNVILEAEIRGATRIHYLQQNRASGARIEVEVSKTGDTIQVWWSRRSTGEVLVREGRFMAAKGSSPVQTRCSN
jgi:hypothetical protein